jgi:hypothetical protein
MFYRLLILTILFLPLSAQSRVRLFAGNIIEENSTLLVKKNTSEKIQACLWLYRKQLDATACEDLFVRYNANRTQAKIYLPSLDNDVETKLVIYSGDFYSEYQEFIIKIKDVTNPRVDLLKRLKFFTNKRKSEDSFSLKAEKADNFFDKEEKYHAQDLIIKPKPQLTKQDSVKLTDVFSLKPRYKPPENPSLGDIFVSDSHALCIFMDKKWLKIVGSGQCVPKPVTAPILPLPSPQPKDINSMFDRP